MKLKRILIGLLVFLSATTAIAQTYFLKVQSGTSSVRSVANAFADVSLVSVLPSGARVLYWNSNYISSVDNSSDTNGWWADSSVLYVAGVPPAMKVINPTDSSVVATIKAGDPAVRVNAPNVLGVIFRLADNTLIGSQWAGAANSYAAVAMGGGLPTAVYMSNAVCGGGQVYNGRSGDTYKFPYNSSGCGFPAQTALTLAVTHLLGY